MEEMASGKPVPEFVPRKHDLMRELFQAFNALIKEWNNRLNAHANGQSNGARRQEGSEHAVAHSHQ
jgi:hypothetical protein